MPQQDPPIGITDVAGILGVTRQQAHRLSQRPDFPTPVAELGRGRLWSTRDVQRWAHLHADRRPGRPETPRP